MGPPIIKDLGEEWAVISARGHKPEIQNQQRWLRPRPLLQLKIGFTFPMSWSFSVPVSLCVSPNLFL